MIEKIILHNFQCHKDVTIDLGRSTVLLGDSNSGKTAVLRALYWVLYNTPSGDSYVSYWSKAKTKFKKDEYTAVTVYIDGHEIVRKRSNEFNGYIVDGEVFEALRTAVPEKVTDIFNLAEASVQKQMDAPFLLSSTPGEASQYLSDLVGLGCVDDILSIAKARTMDTSSKINSLTDEIASLETTAKSYGWVADAEELLKKANGLEPEMERLTRGLDSLSRLIDNYKAIPAYPEIPKWLEREDDTPRMEELSDTIGMLDRYIDACWFLERIEPTVHKLDSLPEPRNATFGERDISALAKSIDDFVDARRVLRRDTNILSRISRLPEPRVSQWSDRDVASLGRNIENYRNAVGVISDCKDYLDDAYDSLVGIACPVCGRPLDKDACLL